MCRRRSIFQRLSSRISQRKATFFSPVNVKEDFNHSSSAPFVPGTIDRDHENQRYTLNINPIVLFGSFLCFGSFAFYSGFIVRVFMNSNSVNQLNGYSAQTLRVVQDDLIVTQLPPPTIMPGKKVPPTTYTYKHFTIDGSRTSHDLHLVRSSADLDDERVDVYATNEDVGEDSEDSSDDSIDDSSDDDEENRDDVAEIHLPAGQHLLVDIKNVDPFFLNSEERLAEAMIQLVDESQLTLLSYHCQ